MPAYSVEQVMRQYSDAPYDQILVADKNKQSHNNSSKQQRQGGEF